MSVSLHTSQAVGNPDFYLNTTGRSPFVTIRLTSYGASLVFDDPDDGRALIATVAQAVEALEDARKPAEPQTCTVCLTSGGHTMTCPKRQPLTDEAVPA